MVPTFLQVFFGLATVLFTAVSVTAESHTITFDNQCGHGTPTLIIGGQVVSTGKDYTTSGHISGIAYLQTGQCLFNGEGCSLLEMTLGNPTCAGCGSSTDISLIPPHAFNVETSFSYFNGCDGQGATCSSPDCSTAFFVPNDNQVQVQCEENNVNLRITFCGDATKAATPAPASSPSPSSSHVTESARISSVSSSIVPSSSISHPIPTPVHSPAEGVAPKPPVESPEPAASPSPAVNRVSCRNNKRSREPMLVSRAEQESRALYELHQRRHNAQRRAWQVGADAYHRSN